MVDGLLDRLGVPAAAYTHGNHPVHTPIDGSAIASVHLESKAQVTAKIDQAEKAFQAWRNVPAPRRGELIRLFGDCLLYTKAKPR
ncbi:aldehyde dehydrogenase family protein [Pseudomonas donghuensis]|uniref:aldehyde dehydrogenase family protein n=1 Tax=Pseudomonas donghuensis TaxID=1163398 RepID=UPI000C2A3681|nr:aldehyde dehydrogenase family protein [Pseudomonas donghuensis]PJY98209.1 hypothetical protein COO64_01315 [Pseudomonas donghuensis]